MSRVTRRSAPAGFTLLEVMVVVTIVGILASVAIPNYQRLLYRTKTAERLTMMERVKQQVQDMYVRTGTSIDPIAHPGVTILVSEWNPPFPPGTQKRMMNPLAATVPIWAEYFRANATTASISDELEGAMYYSYMFVVTEAPGFSSILVTAMGDLDGDGVVSPKTILWTRVNGVYQDTFENPPAGMEDDNNPAVLSF